jgi:hypothetical protein
MDFLFLIYISNKTNLSMKKFSDVSNIEAPKSEPIKETNEERVDIKSAIFNLMENYLTIRSYGSARTELLSSQLKIDGKEMFVEALLDMVNNFTKEDKVQLLESLKTDNRDWESIDSKIDEIRKEVSDIKLESKIKSQIEKWGKSGDLSLITQNKVSKVQDLEYLNKVIQVCEKMEMDNSNFWIKESINIIKNTYKTRFHQICR